jgi:hypothetical protein
MTNPSDSGTSGDPVTRPSTGYILKLVLMLISCIIMNKFMFNCCLNMNICTQGRVRNLDNFLIMLIQKLFDMMMTYTQIDNLNVTHSKHAYFNEL